MRSATAQAGTATTVTLDASASSSDDAYNNMQIEIVSGTGAGNKEFITDYNGTTKVATVSGWTLANPSSDSVFVIRGFGTLPGASAPTAAQVADAVWDEPRADHTSSGSFGEFLQPIRIATAQAGGASTITLDASASSTNDLYQYNIVRILSGTGAGQSRQISGYVGSSKVATVSIAWITQPDNTSVFVLLELGVDAATVSAIADGVWDELRAEHIAAGSFGERVRADVTQISGDTTAADNLESYCDGTTPIPSNATQISGDGTAADNLEALLDGTGGVTLTGNITGNLSGSVGSVTGAVASVTGAVGSVTGAVGSVTGNVGGNVVGSIGSLATQAKADVNAEVVDTLGTDTVAQPGQGTPPATTNMRTQLAYIYKAWRNRTTQTTTQFSLYNDDATTVDQKATVSDSSGTFDRGEYATGP